MSELKDNDDEYYYAWIIITFQSRIVTLMFDKEPIRKLSLVQMALRETFLAT